METTGNKTSWIKIIVWTAIILVIAYLGYRSYMYYQCQNQKDTPCDKAKFMASTGFLSRSGGTFLPLSPDETTTMNALASQVNSGVSLSNADWTKLQALVFRNVKNGGTDPIVHKNGKIKCSFWKSKSCE